MVQPSYWQREWFESGYFPEVWFAPGDETDVPEEELRLEYYGGGRNSRNNKRSDNEERTRLFREHHEYLDGLREIQVQIADDVRGARIIAMRADMAVPDVVLPPSMRGTVPPPRAVDVLGDPLILAALALLIDEADD